MPENAHKPRVLVADDERVIADTLAMILNQSGFQAKVAYTGEKALEMAAEFQPEMLISDVIMAGLNGIDAAIKIREILPSINALLPVRTQSSRATSTVIRWFAPHTSPFQPVRVTIP